MKLIQIQEKIDKNLEKIPENVISDLKKQIRKGARDIKQNWANALELIHKAFEVEAVRRPEPSEREAWKQYEELIKYAVKELANNRGLDSDWRMSSKLHFDNE